MGRFSIAGRASALSTAVRGTSLYSGGSTSVPKIVEVHIYNTTSTAFAVALRRFTAATNVGSGITEQAHDGVTVPLATGFDAHTGDGTAATGVIIAGDVAAAVGAAVIWTFGAGGLAIPAGTGNGIAITCPQGTGQLYDYYIAWDE